MTFTKVGLAVSGCLLLLPAATYGQAYSIEREFPEGDFAVSIAQDALTDANTSFIMSKSANDQGSLGWRCMEDGLNVVIAIGNPYEGDDDDDIVVQYRFDDKAAAPQEYWALFTGKKMAYIRMEKVAEFTTSALGAKKVVLRATDPFDNEARTFVFGLKGLDKALKHLPCAR